MKSKEIAALEELKAGYMEEIEKKEAKCADLQDRIGRLEGDRLKEDEEHKTLVGDLSQKVREYFV